MLLSRESGGDGRNSKNWRKAWWTVKEVQEIGIGILADCLSSEMKTSTKAGQR
jgi:hypothetical protein